MEAGSSTGGLERGGQANAGIVGEITATTMASLERGALPWVRPRELPGVPLRHVGLPYGGFNSLVLWAEADARGYRSPYWLTPRQAAGLGGRLRTGEYPTRVARPIASARKLHAPRVVPAMRPYEVFNAEQFEGLSRRFLAAAPEGARADPDGRAPHTGEFFAATGAEVECVSRGPGGSGESASPRARYHPAEDVISLPDPQLYPDAAAYYSDFARALIHWTGHRGRMDRKSGSGFGDDGSAMEELVAELGAAFVLAGEGLPLRPRRDRASRPRSWSTVLKNERAIFAAASLARRAADYLTLAAASRCVAELGRRRLDDRAYIVVYLDSARVGSHDVLVALAVDSEGRKRLLGVRRGADEAEGRGRAAAALMRGLVRRGLRTDRRRLFVTDGSRELRGAIRCVFGPDFLVQRCRSHVLRTVLARLSAQGVRRGGGGAARRGGRAGRSATQVRKSLRDALRASFAKGAERGPASLAAIAGDLEEEGRAVAARAVRESLSDLFTVDRLGLHPKLRTALGTTHTIFRAPSALSRPVCAPAEWQDPAVAVTWAVASFLAAERGFRRIAGCHHLQLLRDHLAQLALPGTLDRT